MAIFDEPATPKKGVYALGADLSLMSADELDARIGELRDEIERLEAERDRKQQSRAAADAFFR